MVGPIVGNSDGSSSVPKNGSIKVGQLTSFPLDGVVLFDMGSSVFPQLLKVLGEEAFEGNLGLFGIVTGNGEPVNSFLDDVRPGPGVGGQDGVSGRHRFQNGEAKSFIAGESCDDRHTLEQSGKLGRGSIPVEDESLGETGG